MKFAPKNFRISPPKSRKTIVHSATPTLRCSVGIGTGGGAECPAVRNLHGCLTECIKSSEPLEGEFPTRPLTY